MSAYTYPIALGIISLLTFALEAWRPWRKDQKQLRKTLPSDLVHLVFNGHFLGVILYGIASYRLMPPVFDYLRAHGWYDVIHANAAADWPVWVQIPVLLLVLDFVQWGIHIILHRTPLWIFHETHHSVVDGEMDWIVAFRFQWGEIVVYKTLQYLPLAFFGFGYEAVMFHAIFGTLIGHLNHANLNWDYGPLKYVLNNPKMHLWHHDYDRDGKNTVNFGIIFSMWDYIFGTAEIPGEAPRKLGYKGVEKHPTDFFGQVAWPVSKYFGTAWAGRVGAAALGLGLVVMGWYLAKPVPLGVEDLGREASQAGFMHPESMASVGVLGQILGSPDLKLIDARPRQRFEDGHIPGARSVWRPDWEMKAPVKGLAREGMELERLLGSLGIDGDDTVVIYGDGGPEPYRLWWLLRERTGLVARVLDGGIVEWKRHGYAVRSGPPTEVTPVAFAGRSDASRGLHWDAIQMQLEATRPARLVDVRSPAEYRGDGEEPGHVPGAINLPWRRIHRGDADPRLDPPAVLREELASAIPPSDDDRVIGMCSSATRSSGLLFALYQLGVPDAQLVSYEGSMNEYRGLGLPLAKGPTPEGAECSDGICPAPTPSDCEETYEC